MLDRLKGLFGDGDVITRDRYSVFRSSDHNYAQQQKNFCNRFEYAMDAQGLKVIGITSSVANEGKTVSSVSLAKNLASTRRRKVVLVDLDLRKSDLAKGLRFPSTPGLVELLAGGAPLKSVLRNVSSLGLSVIPSGSQVDDPWSLLSRARFRSFLEELRELYDVVLIDTPPMAPVSDAMAIRDLVDKYILVFRLGYTPHTVFRQSLEDIGEKKLLGVLLNGVPPRSEKYYQRYYGKYYRKQAETIPG